MTEAATTENAAMVRHNFIALVGDISLFFIGLSFLDRATVLPTIIAQLGGDSALIGVVNAIQQGVYFLPQLFIAQYFAHRAHRERENLRYLPFVVRACFGCRLWLFPAAFALLFLGKTHPTIALVLLVLAYCTSWFGDGISGVPWTATVGKAIPARTRGRLFATTQMISGGSRLIVGWVVLRLLSGTGLAFPTNVAVIVFCGAVFLLLSAICIALIKEPRGTKETDPTEDIEEAKPNLKLYLASLRARPSFFYLAIAQMLAMTVASVAPFFIAYARAEVDGGLPANVAGTFLIAQTVGLILCAPLWGYLSDRFGPRMAMIFMYAPALLAPVAAFVGGRAGLFVLFLLAYFCYGAVQDFWSTATNYLLEAVPSREQPLYIGIMNAATAPVLLITLSAGQVVKVFGAPVAFTAAFFFILIGWVAVFRLPDTRRRESI